MCETKLTQSDPKYQVLSTKYQVPRKAKTRHQQQAERYDRHVRVVLPAPAAPEERQRLVRETPGAPESHQPPQHQHLLLVLLLVPSLWCATTATTNLHHLVPSGSHNRLSVPGACIVTTPVSCSLTVRAPCCANLHQILALL